MKCLHAGQIYTTSTALVRISTIMLICHWLTIETRKEKVTLRSKFQFLLLAGFQVNQWHKREITPQYPRKIVQNNTKGSSSFTKQNVWTFIFFSFFFFDQLIILLPKNQNSRVRHSHYHMFTLPTSSLPKVSRRGTSLFLFPTQPFMKTLRTSEKRWTGYNRASIRRVIAVIGRLSGFKKKKKISRLRFRATELRDETSVSYRDGRNPRCKREKKRNGFWVNRFSDVKPRCWTGTCC